mgnify:CR=1 FL=1
MDYDQFDDTTPLEQCLTARNRPLQMRLALASSLLGSMRCGAPT